MSTQEINKGIFDLLSKTLIIFCTNSDVPQISPDSAILVHIEDTAKFCTKQTNLSEKIFLIDNSFELASYLFFQKISDNRQKCNFYIVDRSMLAKS